MNSDPVWSEISLSSSGMTTLSSPDWDGQYEGERENHTGSFRHSPWSISSEGKKTSGGTVGGVKDYQGFPAPFPKPNHLQASQWAKNGKP